MSELPTSKFVKRLKKILPPLVILVAVGFAFLFYYSEPRYQGRPFSEWMRLYEQGIDPKRAELAIYAMGPDAVPHLTYCLTASKPSLTDRVVMTVGRLNPGFGFQLNRVLSKLPASVQNNGRLKKSRQSMIAEDLLKNAPETWKSSIISEIKDVLENGSVFQKQPALRVMDAYADEAGPLVPVLSQMLQSGIDELLVPVLDLVRDMGEEATPLGPDLISLFAHVNQTIQSKAVIVASKIKIDPVKAMPALKPMLNSMPGGHRRLVAVQTLSEIAIADEEQIRFLVDALKDPSEDIRGYAAQGLGRLGKDAMDTLDDLIPLLKDEVIGIRATAATAIGNLGPGAKTAIPHLVETMNNDFSGVGQECRQAIEKIDPEQAKFIIVR